jgi:DNA-binding CsgD family transcriptional regulator
MRSVVKKLKAKGLETADIAENLDLSIEKVNGYLRSGSASKAKKT